MSAWTHLICVDCWNAANPNRKVSNLGGGNLSTCCFCGSLTNSGIYTRSDPETTRCKGTGVEHAP